MNRRSFITSALAGLAAIPLLSKIVNAAPIPGKPIDDLSWEPARGPVDLEDWFDYPFQPLDLENPPVWMALGRLRNGTFVELKGGGYERARFNRKGTAFPAATAKWKSVSHFGIAASKDGRALQPLRLSTSVTLNAGETITVDGSALTFGFQ